MAAPCTDTRYVKHGENWRGGGGGGNPRWGGRFLSGRAPNSWSEGRMFKSKQERGRKFFSGVNFRTLFSVFVPSPSVTAGTRKNCRPPSPFSVFVPSPSVTAGTRKNCRPPSFCPKTVQMAGYTAIYNEILISNKFIVKC